MISITIMSALDAFVMGAICIGVLGVIGLIALGALFRKRKQAVTGTGVPTLSADEEKRLNALLKDDGA